MRFGLLLLLSGLLSCKSIEQQSLASNSCPNCVHGNEQGNGGDYLAVEQGSAWFLGETNIKYCIQISSGFGVDKAFASDVIQKSFTKWVNYIEKKKINDRNEYITYDERPALATKFTELPSCDGSELLTFYLGIQNEKIKPYEQQIRTAVAKTIRTHFDRSTTEGKGFIWITSRDSIRPTDTNNYTDGYAISKNFPDWQLSYNLQGIVTHELGHVFGVPHMENTIMTENIARAVRAQSIAEGPNTLINAKSREFYFTHIDWDRELVICESCDLNNQGTFGYYQEYTNDQGSYVVDITSEAFRVLTGENPNGGPQSVQAKIRGNYKDGIVLVVTDNSEEFVFPLKLDLFNKATFTDNWNIFKTLIKTYDGGYLTNGVRSGGHSIPGQLLTTQGVPLNISFDRNMQFLELSENGTTYLVGGQVVIRYSIDGKIRPLFNFHWNGF